MKKLAGIILSLAVVFSLLVPLFSVGAESLAESNETAADNTEAVRDSAISFTCRYDRENKKVKINGSMSHSASLKYKSARLQIYALAPGADESSIKSPDGVQPITDISPTIKFGFGFDVDTLQKKYSRYIVVLRSEDGEILSSTEAKYAEIEPPIEDKGEVFYKGISSGNASISSRIDADCLIVGVDLSEFYKNSYRGSSDKLMLSKSDLDGLDIKINSAVYSLPKHRGVYLKYIWKDENGEALPDLTAEEKLEFIDTLTEAIASRYNSEDDGKIIGIILGNGLDGNLEYGILGLSEYSKKAALYAAVVSSSAKTVDPYIKTVLPFSSKNFTFGDEEGEKDGELKGEALFRELLYIFGRDFDFGREFTLLMTSEDVPFNLEKNQVGADIGAPCPDKHLCARCIDRLTSYLSACRGELSSVPEDLLFLWMPPEELKGEALRAAYAYSYYSLLSSSGVKSFVLSLRDGTDGEEKLTDLLQIMKYIDTPKASEVTEGCLEFFDKDAWNELDGVITTSPPKTKLLYNILPESELPDGIRGSFRFLDFPSSVLDSGWLRGVGCTSIKSEYADNDIKALQAMLSTAENESCEVVYNFGYSEKFKYTPFAQFDFKIENRGSSSESGSSRYEVTVILESAGLRLESNAVLREGARTSVVIDLGDYTAISSFGNIKISVRSLDDESSNSTLWLYGVTGHSVSKDNTELEKLISRERDKENTYVEGNEGPQWRNIIIAAIILAISVALGPVIFFSLRRDGRQKKQ